MKIKLFFGGLREGFQKFGHSIGNIVNFITLFFVYFIFLGLTAIIAKMFNKSFLELKIKRKKSYWIDEKIEKKPIEEYFKQF